MPGEAAETPRVGKQLLDATRQFAVEIPMKSWWHVCSTLVYLGATLSVAALASPWPLRLGASILGGLLMVRAFIMYHDYMHRALLRRSRIAKPVFHMFGLFLLTPPRYWRYSHNHHHGHVVKPLEPEPDAEPDVLMTSDLGSFPLMTTETWRTTSAWQRLLYRIKRHPLTLMCAYLTVFLLGLSLLPLLKSPRKHWDGAISIVAHAVLLAGLWMLVGFPGLFFAFLLPFAIASAIGAYLFYAQHNYEGLHVLEPEEWTYYRGATESSSYMKLGRVADWFTGNIGYHHIHHVNPLVPFYRLPETMAAVPELQEPGITSLRFRDVYACLRLNLWDLEKGRLISYREASRAA